MSGFATRTAIESLPLAHQAKPWKKARYASTDATAWLQDTLFTVDRQTHVRSSENKGEVLRRQDRERQDTCSLFVILFYHDSPSLPVARDFFFRCDQLGA